MANYNDAFPSKYIKASDLQGKAPTVTIDHVQLEQVGKDKEQRWVVYFVGKEKGLVANKTNSRTIATIANSQDTDDWSGVSIQLFVAQVDFAGEVVDAIRVRMPKAPVVGARPKPRPAPVAEPEPDFDPDSLAGDDSTHGDHHLSHRSRGT